MLGDTGGKTADFKNYLRGNFEFCGKLNDIYISIVNLLKKKCELSKFSSLDPKIKKEEC